MLTLIIMWILMYDCLERLVRSKCNSANFPPTLQCVSLQEALFFRLTRLKRKVGTQTDEKLLPSVRGCRKREREIEGHFSHSPWVICSMNEPRRERFNHLSAFALSLSIQRYWVEWSALDDGNGNWIWNDRLSAGVSHLNRQPRMTFSWMPLQLMRCDNSAIWSPQNTSAVSVTHAWSMKRSNTIQVSFTFKWFIASSFILNVVQCGQLRICVPYGNNYFFNFNGTRMSGIIGNLYDDFLKRVSSRTNVTVKFIRADGFGFLQNTGCFGMMASNATDTMASLIDYPIESVNTTQSRPVTSVTPQFLTAYSKVDKLKVYNLLSSSLQSVSTSFWLLSAAAVFSLWLLLWMSSKDHAPRENGRKRRRAKTSSSFFLHILSHIIRFGQIVITRSVASKLIFFITSFISLVVVSYFVSGIKTELVVATKPQVYTDYSQLIDKRVKIFFFRGLGYGVPFKYSPLGTRERTLWDTTLHTTKKNVFLITDSAGFLKHSFDYFIRRKSVLLLDSISGQTILTSACTIWHRMKLLKRFDISGTRGIEIARSGLHLSQDDNAREKIEAMIFWCIDDIQNTVSISIHCIVTLTSSVPATGAERNQLDTWVKICSHDLR